MVEGYYSNSRRSALGACSIGLGFVRPKVGNSPEFVWRPGRRNQSGADPRQVHLLFL